MNNANKKSSRHHYVPQFYIKGFSNQDNLLYVYDKQLDIIKKNPIGSAGIFFEADGNTIKFEEYQSSELEDEYYKAIDNHFAKALVELKEETDIKTYFSERNRVNIHLFIVSLFWRNPSSDWIIKSILDNSDSRFLTKEGVITKNSFEESLLKRDDSFLKIAKARLLLETIDRMKPEQEGEACFKRYIYPKKAFLIGDNPVIHRIVPENFNDLYYADYVLPVTSQIVVSRVVKTSGLINENLVTDLNLTTVHQAQRYVASPDLELLEKIVMLYKLILVHRDIESHRESLFK